MKHTILPSFLLTAFLTGCTTAKIVDYHPASPAATERTIQQSGVEVALDPFVENSRTEKFFDVDAVDNGIAILHVRLANNTGNQTFLVEKKDFQLVPKQATAGLVADGTTIESPKDHKGIDTATVIFAGSVAGAVLGVSGAAATSHSSEIQRNFAAKEMADQTLSPGETMEGFVYFSPVTKGQDWSRTMTAKIRLTETRTHQATELTVPLSL